ncbi:GDP-mannose transporter into the lumen of the Golgi [Basidiobolus meristosporus CBS 931.73]|uniref:GDP-mannose transporter into the lumen of the Golgi n=1 Tax=Basidiobolus meristosporus CBS 931.73 TaxID=1314790 RepID=A0A1Y1XQ47_9FUNG|nr:GDP-mannose transporter into the lumen of the Golgi [Basidiobolus meristosporus CBS 931.73]|eukprot:ORX87636.1 GDP-mannose transporter into the lumen of the Golgi [Basidiobolus meristosporus CBS 931.73]
MIKLPSPRSLGPIFAYCFASVFMTLVNKLVLSEFSQHPVFLILAIQSMCCILLVKSFAKFGLIEHRKLNKEDLRTWLPISILMAVMLYTGGKSLQFLRVPLFTIFKNLTIILVAYGEKIMFRIPVTNWMLMSFALMILSSLVGGWNDIEFNLEGYIWMFINCISSALYVLQMRKIIKLVNFKDFDTVYYNNLMLIPIFLFMSLISERWTSLVAYYQEEDHAKELNSFAVAILISGCSSFMISYCSAWCIRMSNSTTYSMVGALNKLPMAIVAMIYFKDPVTSGGIMAILLGFFSGLVYTYSKIRQPKPESTLPTSIPIQRRVIACEKEGSL